MRTHAGCPYLRCRAAEDPDFAPHDEGVAVPGHKTVLRGRGRGRMFAELYEMGLDQKRAFPAGKVDKARGRQNEARVPVSVHGGKSQTANVVIGSCRLRVGQGERGPNQGLREPPEQAGEEQQPYE